MPKKTKPPAPPVLLQIEVPGPSRAQFWKRPDGKLEFWAFKDRPRAFVNERIVFTFDRQPVAEARILKIEAPGSSKCHATGQYERYHKVFWDPGKFVKYKIAAGGSPAFYHLSRRTNRGSISSKGLLPLVKEYKHLQRRPGIFLFTSPEMAKDYGFYFAQYINQAVDVWEVRLPDGYKVSPDKHPDMEGFNAWVGYDSIPPENVGVVDTVLVPTSKSKPPKFSAEEHEDSFYWFEPGFPEDARKFIAANKDQGRTEFCEKESRAWASKLAAAGFPVELVKGDYRDPKMPDIALVAEHWWVEVGGRIFDPTAIQFGEAKPERDMYVEWDRHRQDSDLVKYPAKDGWWLHRTRTGADKVLDVGEGDEYWAGEGNAASGVLPVCPKKGTVCLAWRSSQVMTPNCWGTIGGAVQEGMSPQQSAKSEMAEETGYHGGVTLHSAFVFTHGAFKYFNYVGVVTAEFAFHPGADHGWETDHIAWVPYQEVLEDMQKNPGDYHPGVLKLFSASRDVIERALGVGKQAGKTAWQEIVHSDPKGDTTGGILETDKELAEWARDSASVEDMEGFMKALAGTKKIGVIDAMNSWFPGHGNGTEMLNKFVAECKAKGCDAIVLQAATLNQQRKGFDLVKWYKRHGFYEFGYSKGIGPMMVKRLKSPLTKKKKRGAEIEFRDENRDYHDEQSDMTLRAYADGREVGRVEYAVFRGEPSVQWIEVGDKGKGYGPALLKELQRMFPDKQIDLGYTTDEGTKMVDKLKFREEPSAEAPLFEELKGLVKERDWLQGIADRFFEQEQHTEEQKAEFGEQMERMNAVHDRIWEIEQATYGKSPAKRLIASHVNPTMLMQIAWEARDKVIPSRDAKGGDCETVSDEIVAELHRRGFDDAYTAYGQWEGFPQHPHAWVEVAGFSVDATRDQFSVFMDDPKREAELLDNPVLVKRAAQGQLFPDSVDARFRTWFNGSKVVDKQGQPLPVYHGTRSSVDFAEFSVSGPETDDWGESLSSGSGADPTALMGAHFAEEANVANQFAMGQGWTKSRYEGEAPMPRVLKVYLRITNPKDFGSEHNLREFIYQGKVHGDATDLAMQADLGIDAWEAEENEAAQAWYQKYDSDTAFRTEQNRYLIEQQRGGDRDVDLQDAAHDLAMQARDRLSTAGHDGVRYKNVVEGGHAWIAFEPNQIKSAWAQRYDPLSAEITSSASEKPSFRLPTQQEIVSVLRKHPLIRLKHKPNRAFLVGSFSKNQQNEESDVDILLEIDPVPGETAEQIETEYRRPLQAHFMKNNIRGKNDAVHPQWCGRRVDVYFTYDADKESRPKVQLAGGKQADWDGTSFAAFTAALFTRKDPQQDPPQMRSFEEVTEGQEQASPAIALASWGKTAAGFMFKSFKKLWHVGSMNAADKRDNSYEGAGLSVSVNPEEWQQIARIGGDLWELTKSGNRFVSFHRVTKAQRKAIMEWGLQQGLAEAADIWRYSHMENTEYGDEPEERYSDFESEAKAREQLGGGSDEKVEKVEGGVRATPKLGQRAHRSNIDPAEVYDLLVTVYAEDVLDCDGVWWQDSLDPANLSAPRGVIFPSKLPSWTKRKTSAQGASA